MREYEGTYKREDKNMKGRMKILALARFKFSL